jgi:putative DNA primase/helicase
MESETQSFTLNELGNAQRLEAEFKGKYIWTKATDWLVYSNGRWVRDSQKSVVRAMIHVIECLEATGDEEEVKWARRSGSSKVINGSLAIASGLKGFARNYAAFDKHPELFNCANGTYNLETGEFQEHSPNDLLTKQSPVKYDPAATCPKFEKFLLEVMAGKETMRLFLQRACGYTMSAYTSEPVLMIPYGRGGTGKSQFLIIMRGIMGGYSSVADSEMFMTKKGDTGQPFEMAGKDGVRSLFASEVEEGKRLAQAKVKQLTGSDPVLACYKGKEAYEFTPQWKIWLATNDRPTVAAGDDAIWDRLKLIPFDIKFRGTSQQVMDIGAGLLAEEASGILNWFIAGFNMWKTEGLNYPAEVLEAVEEWKGDEDYLGKYLEEHVGVSDDPNEFVPKSTLFANFTRWAKDTKEGRWLNDKQFAELLRRRGFEAKQVRQLGKNNRCWIGLKMLDPLRNFYESARTVGPDELEMDFKPAKNLVN